MSSMRRSLLILVFIIVLAGCQANPVKDANRQPEEPQASVGAGETVEGESEPFRPYDYAEVPELKMLIFAEGFKEYTSEQPYLLGYSYEGNYIATIIYDANQEGYIVEVTDTFTNHVAYEAFVPEADRILEGDQVSVDLLTTAQESLDMGYRIKVAPIVNEQEGRVFEQRGAENEVFHFRMSVVEGKLFRITVRDERDRTWLVVNDRAPFNPDREFVQKYTWAIHPQVPDRVNVMVYTTHKDQPVKPYVYTVNTAALDEQMSEKSLHKTLSEWLEEPKIVYRYPSTDNALSILAVETEDEAEKADAPLYAGRVTQFVLLGQNGDMMVHATGEGVFNSKDELISSAGEASHYNIALVPGPVTAEAELFVVDVYNRDNEIVQTLEWKWSVKKRAFELIKTGETE